MKFTTAIAKGDTLQIREAIKEAILNSQINKPIDIDEEVDEKVLEYGRRLKKFDFGNEFLEKEEAKLDEIRRNKQKNELILNVNKAYSETYPNHIIIPISDLTKILKKYDLFSGSTKYYNKLIPQKNLLDMEDFWEKSKSKLGFGNFNLYNLENLNISSFGELTYFKEKDIYYSRSKEKVVTPKSLQIIAPLSEFNVGKEEKVIGNFIVHDSEFDEKNIKIPKPLNLDPIVWMPVKYPSVGGAALIVTQWGPEADLPEFNKKK